MYRAFKKTMEDNIVTIKDIAKALGVSVSTVSRALKDSPSISQERKKQIQDYAKQHRYKPNILASTLRSQRHARPQIIGVVVPQFTHHYFSRVLTGIEECCLASKYRIMVAQSDDSYEREKQILEAFRLSQVKGIIISQAKDTTDYSHFEEAIKDNIPLVFYDRICTGLRTSRVVVDDYQGAFTATEHLIKTGCRNICHYSANMNLEISKNRFNGYKDALLKYGIPYRKEMVILCDNRNDAETITPKVISSLYPDGFFATNDDTALGILYSVKRMGMRVPEDISICGFTNGTRAISCEPQLTTVEQRGLRVGEEAAKALIDQLEGRIPPGKYRNQIIKTKLIVRGTTRPVSTDIQKD